MNFLRELSLSSATDCDTTNVTRSDSEASGQALAYAIRQKRKFTAAKSLASRVTISKRESNAF
jgi:hypothetical protein